jgi:hypothetical protein
MSFEITNTLRSSSIIRVVDVGYANVALANLAFNANETVDSASIKRVNWATTGNIRVLRNGVDVLQLYGTGEIRLDDFGHSIANNSTGNVQILVTTSGTIFLELSKDTSYATALVG